MNPGEGVYGAILMTAFLSTGTKGSFTPLMDTYRQGGSKGRTLEPCEQQPLTCWFPSFLTIYSQREKMAYFPF